MTGVQTCALPIWCSGTCPRIQRPDAPVAEILGIARDDRHAVRQGDCGNPCVVDGARSLSLQTCVVVGYRAVDDQSTFPEEGDDTFIPAAQGLSLRGRLVLKAQDARLQLGQRNGRDELPADGNIGRPLAHC